MAWQAWFNSPMGRTALSALQHLQLALDKIQLGLALLHRDFSGRDDISFENAFGIPGYSQPILHLPPRQKPKAKAIPSADQKESQKSSRRSGRVSLVRRRK